MKTLPENALIIIPMRNTVLFPGVISPITVGRAGSIAAAQEAVRAERKVGFLLQRDPAKDEVEGRTTSTGSAPSARWCATSPAARARTTSWCRARTRFRVLEFLEGWPFLVARVEMVRRRRKSSRPRSRRASCS